jgi:putative PIN family toxin of toxin-antitoxin system
VKVFLDTNVLVAAFATRGLCADVVRLVLAEHELLVSPAVLEELARALTGKLHVPEQTTREVVAFLRASASTVEASVVPPIDVRDPDDAVILGQALANSAEVLVTGDKDLLDLGAVPRLRVLNPREFWQFARKPRKP